MEWPLKDMLNKPYQGNLEICIKLRKKLGAHGVHAKVGSFSNVYFTILTKVFEMGLPLRCRDVPWQTSEVQKVSDAPCELVSR